MKELPLYNAIKRYAEGAPARFHMPGHKGAISLFDVTEVNGTDDLHSPSGPILESEKMCAKALGAREGFFLINGSSAGNLAMLSLLKPGSRVLLGRNCHKSVINGIALAGLDHVPVYPDERGVFSAENIVAALEKYPCEAVFITSPAYNGYVSPIDEIAEAAHSRGALLFVDCAHGAHFAFSERLPGVPAAADAWCVSTHKTLSALTQTAMLLIGKNCTIERAKVQRSLSLYQSTSPSYMLMLSIESSVLKPEDWDSHIDRIVHLRNEFSAIPGIEVAEGYGNLSQDITRLYIMADGSTGYELACYLEDKGIVPEMADMEGVTLITSPKDPDEWYEMLIEALKVFSPITKKPRPILPPLENHRGEKLLSVREAVLGETESIPLASSTGRICACAVGCYPPGVAALFPGEVITEDAVSYLLGEEAAGAELFGTDNGNVTVVKNA